MLFVPFLCVQLSSELIWRRGDGRVSAFKDGEFVGPAMGGRKVATDSLNVNLLERKLGAANLEQRAFFGFLNHRNRVVGAARMRLVVNEIRKFQKLLS